MATGRIGVTPTLGTRWSKAPAGGTTSLSGLDDNSVALVYSVGYEQVYRNGVLLSRGNDYTATTGNSITLTDATIAGDIIEVFANELVPLTDAISKGQFTAKGALLSATAASTPGVLAVGTNGQYLQADSTASTGLKWADVSAGSFTELATGTLSGTAVTLNSINQTYRDLRLYVYNTVKSGVSGSSMIVIDINNVTSNNYSEQYLLNGSATFTAATNRINTQVKQEHTNSVDNIVIVNFLNYAQSTYRTEYNWVGSNNAGAVVTQNLVSGNGYDSGSTKAAITRIDIKCQGDTFASGNYILYGVK